MLKRSFVFLLTLVLIVGVVQVGMAKKEKAPRKVSPEWQMKVPAPQFEEALAGTVLFATFETGEEGFQPVDGTDVPAYWHESAFNAYDVMSWWCADEGRGGYGNWWYQVLDTDPIQLGSDSYLTCKVFQDCECSACEDPAYACDWDGGHVRISTDGGTTFEVIEPVVGEYDSECDSLWAFQFHGEIPQGGYPGWICTTQVWFDAEFDLSAYDGHEVIIRFIFASDQATSSFDGMPEATGMQVDEIEVSDNTGVIFFNDAGDSKAKEGAQGDMHPGVVTRGIHWALTDADAHSPTHSWHIDYDDHPELQTEWLETPWIDLPAGEYPEASFWIRNNAPDSDGDDDGFLEDLFQMEITTNDTTWDKMFHDYQRLGVDSLWTLWDKDVIYNGFLRLDQYAGQSMKMRWRTICDTDDDGGNGEGMFIDDVVVFSRGAPDNDVGIERVIVPFPHSVNYDIPVTGYIRNYGLLDQPAVIAWYFVEDADGNKVVSDQPTGPPWPSIPSGDTLAWEFDFTPADTGVYRVYFYQFVPDQYPPNDSGFSALFRVYPEKEGYMAHHYYLREYGWSVGAGEGPAMLFDPPADVYPYNVETLEIELSGIGDIVFRAYEASGVEDTIPDDGTLLFESEAISVPEHSGSEYYGVDVSEVPELQGMSGPFFVWVVWQEGADLHWTGATSPFPPTHSFRFDEGEWDHVGYDYNMRCYLNWRAPGCVGLRGDPTGDGAVNVLDVLADVNHILGIQELTGDAYCRG
ncbi:MAG: hypothetical protein ACE5OR_13220, partial [bacterium]